MGRVAIEDNAGTGTFISSFIRGMNLTVVVQ
jgi:hypothetical protein